MNRRDLIAECIQPGLPIALVTKEWCPRCLNPECVRSAFGSSRFDRRVEDLEGKLFLHPPTMNPDDPKFAGIVARNFITIDPGRMPEIRSDWVDPNDIKEPEPEPPVILTPPVTSPEPPAPQPSSPNETTSKQSTSFALVGVNAPDQSGKVLRGGAEASKTKEDPWAAPDPPDPSDQVIKPGATIKMGREPK